MIVKLADITKRAGKREKGGEGEGAGHLRFNSYESSNKQTTSITQLTRGFSFIEGDALLHARGKLPIAAASWRCSCILYGNVSGVKLHSLGNLL